VKEKLRTGRTKEREPGSSNSRMMTERKTGKKTKRRPVYATTGYSQQPLAWNKPPKHPLEREGISINGKI
jgi:hypothetical protein